MDDIGLTDDNKVFINKVFNSLCPDYRVLWSKIKGSSQYGENQWARDFKRKSKSKNQ